METPVVLQSGFVAIPNNNYVIEPPTEEEDYTMRDLKYNNHIIRMQSSFAYHGGLNKLWQEYLANGLILHDFNTKERLFRLTYDCFNNLTFQEFLTLQSGSSSITKYNRAFMDDVWRIINSEQPQVSLAAHAEMVFALPYTNGLDMYDRSSLVRPTEYVEVITVTDLIERLVANHNGTETLMMVMGIIFGNKRVPILHG